MRKICRVENEAGESRVGCGCSPPAVTTDGNADRLGIFSDLDFDFSGWVAETDIKKRIGCYANKCRYYSGFNSDYYFECLSTNDCELFDKLFYCRWISKNLCGMLCSERSVILYGKTKTGRRRNGAKA